MVYSLTPENESDLTRAGKSERTSSSTPNSLNRSRSNPSSSNELSLGKTSKDMNMDLNSNDEGDLSWVQLPNPDAEEITEMVENLETARKSLGTTFADSGTQSSASLDPRTVEMEKHFGRLQEDNARLISILQENNEAMKRNLSHVHSLRSELSTAREAYNELREASSQQIADLRERNEQLQQRIQSMEEEMRQKSLDKSIHYYPLDVNHEMTVHDMSSKIVERDVKIQRLSDELNSLRKQLDQTSNGIARMSLNEEQRRPSGVGMYEMPSSFNESQADLIREMKELKEIVTKLREEKMALESYVSGSNTTCAPSSTGYGRPDVSESYGEDDNYEGDNGHGRRRRGHHHRHHRHHSKFQKVKFPTDLLIQGLSAGLSQASQAVTNSMKNFMPPQPTQSNQNQRM